MFKKILFIILAVSMALTAISCDKTQGNQTIKSNKTETKTGVQPIADDEIAVIEMEKPVFGTIKIELYSNIAPQMVKRFKELAKEGFYNGTTFHRVSPMVIQGGDPNSKDNDPNNDGMGDSDKPNVPAEFSDVPYEKGIVGAARLTDINTANCQFFITMKRMQQWDKNYTVFGKVIEGMNYADLISGVPRNGEAPIEKVVIKSITFQTK